MEKKSMLAFGAKGWTIVIFGLLTLFCTNAGVMDGVNVTLPAITEANNLDYELCLGMGTIAGFVGAAMLFIIGKLRDKIGIHQTAGILMLIFGITFATIFLRAQSVFLYGLGMCLLVGCGEGTFFMCVGVIQTSWFPKKRGIVVGISAMGATIGSVVIVPMLTLLRGLGDYRNTFLVVSALAFLIAAVAFFVWRDSPLEAGVYPDNISRREYEENYRVLENQVEYVSDWNFKRLIRTKETWSAIFVPGIMGMCMASVVTQFLNRNMELGFSQVTAVICMSAAAVIGIVGSFVFGTLDTKAGTKKAATIYCTFFAVSLLVNVLAGWIPILIYPSIVMIGLSLGGASPFQISWGASIFGSLDFPAVNAFCFPIQYGITSLNFVMNAMILKITGSLTAAYLVYAVLLLINIVLILRTDATKWNKMVHPELKNRI